MDPLTQAHPAAAAAETAARLWRILRKIPDPEIPVINIVELGIVRDVLVGDGIEIVVTPTYTGCPATETIRADIARALARAGFGRAKITTRLTPPWTTGSISAEARVKLQAFGIAPPSPCAHQASQFRAVACPRCGSRDTELVSEFGATPCKAAMRCKACREPFERFKCV